MAGRLASVPEFGEWDNQEPALPPPRNLYRDLIRNVVVSRGHYIRHPDHTGSSYSNSSGASSSCYLSNSSDCSSGSASATATAESCVDYDQPNPASTTTELTKIARLMVNDGYARRMVNAFGAGGGPDHAHLATWFLELDVDWVLQIHGEHGLPRQLQDRPTSLLQELINIWIRALTVIVVSMAELVQVVTVDETPAVARFCKASMVEMLAFVDAIIPALKEDKLRTLVDMYACVSSASYRFASYRFTLLPISPEAQTILNDIGRSLSTEVISLREAISGTMEEVKTLVEDDDSWAILIPRGRGEVHRNTRLMLDCIMSMVKAEGSMPNTAQGHDSNDTANLCGLIDDSVHYLKDLLLRKSEHSSDASLRYLFLLNNFYSVAQLCATEPRPGAYWLLTPECNMIIHSYLSVSWGHVLSHIQKTVFKDGCLDVSCGHVLFCMRKAGFREWRQHRKKTSSLAKFESAFHKSYKAQKFWKVPDPQLRDILRKTITDKVISEYRNYLKKHPELEKHVSSGPDVLREMVGELFEG